MIFVGIVPASAPLPDCIPGFKCAYHATCSRCGDTIHLGPVEGTMMIDDPLAFTRMVVGDPPVCTDCKQAARRA